MKLSLVLFLAIQATITLAVIPRDGGTYKIVSESCGQVLVLGTTTEGGYEGRLLQGTILVVGQPDLGSPDQAWTMLQQIPGVFGFENQSNGLFMTSDGTSPNLSPFSPGAVNQTFQLIPVGGSFMIQPLGGNATGVFTLGNDGSISLQPGTGAVNQTFTFQCAR